MGFRFGPCARSVLCGTVMRSKETCTNIIETRRAIIFPSAPVIPNACVICERTIRDFLDCLESRFVRLWRFLFLNRFHSKLLVVAVPNDQVFLVFLEEQISPGKVHFDIGGEPDLVVD